VGHRYLCVHKCYSVAPCHSILPKPIHRPLLSPPTPIPVSGEHQVAGELEEDVQVIQLRTPDLDLGCAFKTRSSSCKTNTQRRKSVDPPPKKKKNVGQKYSRVSDSTGSLQTRLRSIFPSIAALAPRKRNFWETHCQPASHSDRLWPRVVNGHRPPALRHLPIRALQEFLEDALLVLRFEPAVGTRNTRLEANRISRSEQSERRETRSTSISRSEATRKASARAHCLSLRSFPLQLWSTIRES